MKQFTKRFIAGIRLLTALLAGTVLGLVFIKLLRRQREIDLRGRVVLVTGSSRGLGFLLAREFARHGCRIVLCARDGQELEHARAALEEMDHAAPQVLAIPCDVSDQAQVALLVDQATRHFGRVDILVNNAGVIQVGPIETMRREDFEEAMGVMYWGTLYPTLAVLPQMIERQRGHIVNITSIGGQVSVPHLLPYNSAKFATVGLSEGLRAELDQHGIMVTTIVPGLMRTGSYLNAFFKGQQSSEFSWFALGASLPLISMNAERAAQQIVQATRRGETERVLTLPALVLARFHGLFPGLTSDILALVNRWILPAATSSDSLGQIGDPAQFPGGLQAPPLARAPGIAIQERLESPRRQIINALTLLGRRAAARFQQFPDEEVVTTATPQQEEREQAFTELGL